MSRSNGKTVKKYHFRMPYNFVRAARRKAGISDFLSLNNALELLEKAYQRGKADYAEELRRYEIGAWVKRTPEVLEKAERARSL